MPPRLISVRWWCSGGVGANGGLLIIGKFFRIVHARHQQGNDVKLGEWALRVNYMASIAWSSFGLMFLLAYPFDQRLLSRGWCSRRCRILPPCRAI